MDIVDAQIHLGLEGPAPLAAEMDALGIRSALLYEFWGGHAPGALFNTYPGFALANGAWRSAQPVAEQAALQHPGRFACVLKVDRRDPDLAELLQLASTTPHCRAVRILPLKTPDEAEAFASGAYDRFFDLAQSLALPVFVFAPGRAQNLGRYLRDFPGAMVVLDHCGAAFANVGGNNAAQPDGPRCFEDVLELAAFDNLYLKWAHAQTQLLSCASPYAALRPLLRRAINAFGPQRLIWASDHTVIPSHTWGDLLMFIRDSEDLTTEEKEWILGRSIRRLLNWPAAE